MKNTSILDQQIENKWAEIESVSGHVYYDQTEIDHLANLLMKIIDLEVIKQLWLKASGE